MTQPETGLRSRIAAAAGELRRVKARVDWDGEIGAVTHANMALAGPALPFENIRGHGDTPCARLRPVDPETRRPDGGPAVGRVRQGSGSAFQRTGIGRRRLLSRSATGP